MSCLFSLNSEEYVSNKVAVPKGVVFGERFISTKLKCTDQVMQSYVRGCLS